MTDKPTPQRLISPSKRKKPHPSMRVDQDTKDRFDRLRGKASTAKFLNHLMDTYEEVKIMTIYELLRDLNSYEGDNIWEDVIRRHPYYDDVATAEADPTGASDTFVLSDGTHIIHVHHEGTWKVRP